MKKTILTVAIALLTGTSANAQYYIGGSFSFSNSFSKVNEVKGSSEPSYSLSISPEIGYQLNEKTAIGLSLSAAFSSTKQPNVGWDIHDNVIVRGVSETKSDYFAVAPYIRYSLFKWKKFDLLGMANVFVSTETRKLDSVYSYEYEHEFGSGSHYAELRGKVKTTALGAGFHPVLLYNLSNKLTLLSHLNLFGVAVSYERQKIGENDYTRAGIGYDLGFNTRNVLPTIGFIYKW
jgi:hypothetical protein